MEGGGLQTSGVALVGRSWDLCGYSVDGGYGGCYGGEGPRVGGLRTSVVAWIGEISIGTGVGGCEELCWPS